MENEQAKQLLSEYYRFIESVANKYRLPEHHQDLMQVGRIAVVESFQTFDSTKSNDLKGHICANIKYAINKYVDQNLRTIRIPANILYSKEEEDAAMMVTTVSANLQINDDGDTLEQLLPSTDTYVYPEPNETLKTLLMHFDKLKPKYQDVIRLAYDLDDTGQPMTYREISEVLGMTKQGVEYIHTQAIKQLQKLYGLEPTKIRKQTLNYTKK